MQKITPFLWFDSQAEEAARFYCSLFKDSGIDGITHYGEGGMGVPGTVMTVTFHLAGQGFTALNGGPVFQFNEAISLSVNCESQPEVDDLWEKLTEGGQEVQCGWLKDKYGLSWQIVPAALGAYIGGPDPEGAGRATQAMLQMKKLDIEKIRQAYEGK